MEPTRNPTTKPVIAVDIDDVIAGHAEMFVEFSNTKYGTNLTVHNYRDHWAELWDVEPKETERRVAEFHGSGRIASCKIIEGSHEALNELKKRFTLILLTARRDSVNQLTREWIDTHYPHTFDDLIFAGFFDDLSKDGLAMTKAELARNIRAQYLIDDQFKHIKATAEIGIQGILFGEYGWNKIDTLPPNVTRARNWEEVLKYFEGK